MNECRCESPAVVESMSLTMGVCGDVEEPLCPYDEIQARSGLVAAVSKLNVRLSHGILSLFTYLKSR